MKPKRKDFKTKLKLFYKNRKNSIKYKDNLYTETVSFYNLAQYEEKDKNLWEAIEWLQQGYPCFSRCFYKKEHIKPENRFLKYFTVSTYEDMTTYTLKASYRSRCKKYTIKVNRKTETIDRSDVNIWQYPIVKREVSSIDKHQKKKLMRKYKFEHNYTSISFGKAIRRRKQIRELVLTDFEEYMSMP